MPAGFIELRDDLVEYVALRCVDHPTVPRIERQILQPLFGKGRNGRHVGPALL